MAEFEWEFSRWDEETGESERFLVGFTYSYRPGRYSGRPEDCYEAEEELEFLNVYRVGEGGHLTKLEPHEWPEFDEDDEREAIGEAERQMDRDEEDWADAEYDARKEEEMFG